MESGIGHEVFEHDGFHECLFPDLPIMGMQPKCRNLPLMDSYEREEGQWAVQGGGWE